MLRAAQAMPARSAPSTAVEVYHNVSGKGRRRREPYAVMRKGRVIKLRHVTAFRLHAQPTAFCQTPPYAVSRLASVMQKNSVLAQGQTVQVMHSKELKLSVATLLAFVTPRKAVEAHHRFVLAIVSPQHRQPAPLPPMNAS